MGKRAKPSIYKDLTPRQVYLELLCLYGNPEVVEKARLSRCRPKGSVWIDYYGKILREACRKIEIDLTEVPKLSKVFLIAIS